MELSNPEREILGHLEALGSSPKGRLSSPGMLSARSGQTVAHRKQEAQEVVKWDWASRDSSGRLGDPEAEWPIHQGRDPNHQSSWE